MARYGRGLICLTLTRERCQQLAAAADGSDNRSPARDQFHRVHRGGAKASRRASRRTTARARCAPPSAPNALPGDLRAARAHLSADGAAGRRADPRRAHRGRLRSGAPGGPGAGRGHRRDPERGRQHGAASRSGGVRARARAQDRHHRRPDPLPHRATRRRSSASPNASWRPSTATSSCSPTMIIIDGASAPGAGRWARSATSADAGARAHAGHAARPGRSAQRADSRLAAARRLQRIAREGRRRGRDAAPAGARTRSAAADPRVAACMRGTSEAHRRKRLQELRTYGMGAQITRRSRRAPDARAERAEERARPGRLRSGSGGVRRRASDEALPESATAAVWTCRATHVVVSERSMNDDRNSWN